MHGLIHSAIDYANRTLNETAVQLRSKVVPQAGIVRLTLMLCGVASASGETVPTFRTNAQLQALDVNAGASETSPPGSAARDLFSGLPELRPPNKAASAGPSHSPPMPGLPKNSAWPQTAFRLGGSPSGTTPSRAGERTPETPIFLQRHPDRNLPSQDGVPAFTLRSASDSGVLAQLTIGLQADTWHTDNLTNTQRKSAAGEIIAELRPIMLIDVGSPPAGRTADAASTDYYLRLRYTPTLHVLADAGNSRTLQRVTGEIGRVSPVLTTRVRFEYDEDIFGSRGSGTVEESSTVTEIVPFVEYSLNAKTAIHGEGTWRRVAPDESASRRTEYVFETGVTCAVTPKTTLGAGMEFAHIKFDHAQAGAQNYQQAYASMAWQASPKIRFQTRAGVELRQFDTPVPRPARVTPVATAVVNWLPGDNTQLNAGFLVRNQPSVSQRGTTFQEIRFGVDGRQRIAENFYIRGEAAIIRRAYDSGTKELEAVVRPAIGYNTRTSRIFDSLNAEIYYQFGRVDSNRSGSDRDRNIFGIESTLFF